MIADCEGNKIKWLLITGATSTTPINRWIKPRVGDIYQVEFPDNNTFLNNNINIGKVKADISAEAFYQEVHTHLQEAAVTETASAEKGGNSGSDGTDTETKE